MKPPNPFDSPQNLLTVELLREGFGLGRRVRLRALGFSMHPTIHSGDTIEAMACDAARLKPGDIVVARRRKKIFVHRIHQLKRLQGPESLIIITKGDALPAPDPPLHSSAVLARVVSCGETWRERLAWRIANRFLWEYKTRVLGTVRRLADIPFYQSLLRIGHKLIGSREILTPLLQWPVKAIKSLMNRGGPPGRVGRLPIAFVSPKIHVLEIEAGSVEAPLLELWNLCFPRFSFEGPEPLRRSLFLHFFSDQPLCFVAAREDRLLGFIFGVKTWPDRDGARYGSVEALGVKPGYRRRGIGTLLFSHLSEAFREAGLGELGVCRNAVVLPGVDPEEEEAVRFFARRGFPRAVFVDEMVPEADTFKEPFALQGIRRRCQDRVEVKPFQRGQTPALVRFIRQESPEELPRMERYLAGQTPSQAGDFLIVATRDSEVLGYLLLLGQATLLRSMNSAGSRGLRPVLLSAPVASSSFQGKGIRALLMSEAIRLLLKRGPAPSSRPAPVLTSAPTWYRKFGFRTAGRWLRFSGARL